jgi:hypothetical protein
MNTKIGKITMATFGLISIGLLIAGGLGLWAWRTTSYFSHGMFQGHSMMYYGTNPWGILLAVGVILLIGIGVISLIKNTTDQNSRDIPLCTKCGEELLNSDWEFCPSCGEPTGDK